MLQSIIEHILVFLATYNRKLAVLPRSTTDTHAPLDPAIDLDFLFSIHDTRTISKIFLIHYHNIIYQIQTNSPSGNLIGREVQIIENEQGEISAFLKYQHLAIGPLSKHTIKQLRVVSSKPFSSRAVTPSVDHP